MRKVFVVASREYQAAVRTKTFLLGLLMMPIMMGGSALMQYLLKDSVDITEKRYGLIDRVPERKLTDALVELVEKYNSRTRDPQGVQLRPRFVLEVVQPTQDAPRQRYELAERVRQGKMAGFLEILDGESQPLPPPEKALRAGLLPGQKPYVVLRYESNRTTDNTFTEMAKGTVSTAIQLGLAGGRQLSEAEKRMVMSPVLLQAEGLTALDPATGEVKPASEQSRVGSVVVPLVMTLLMFMVVLMCATPLMQGVVEEKMQRIAEVLLGSVPPFPLMLGKLLGMTAVSLTISAVYLGGAWWAAHHFGFAEHLSVDLLLWFVVLQALAALMFGSLFIAVGAACTDLKETQNLMWPVMLLAMLPMFVLGQVLREPNSPAVTGLSFFPFATPALMIARMSVPPGIPWWQPALGVVVVLATTVLCVWASGRIFRVGLLMQGKGARFGEMLKWVFRG